MMPDTITDTERRQLLARLRILREALTEVLALSSDSAILLAVQDALAEEASYGWENRHE